MSTSLDKLNAKVFSEQLHTQFTIHTDAAAPVALELMEVMESDPAPKIELFSLHFRGPAEPRLPQRIYGLEHPRLGTFEIFLTAIGADLEQRILYESVFHRFRKPAAQVHNE